VRDVGLRRGDLVGVAVGDDGRVGISVAGRSMAGDVSLVEAIESELRPRWVTWTPATGRALVGAGIRVATSWDVVTVHRLMAGAWRVDEARAWAWLHDLPVDSIPSGEPFDLFHQSVDQPDAPVLADGHLQARWPRSTPERLAQW